MTPFRKPIQVEEVIGEIWEYYRGGKNEIVRLRDSLDRFLAEDIIATTDIPRFDKSPYDGFALRSIDVKEATREHIIELKVIDRIGAGMISKKKVQPFEAIRIMTGAQMPDGCDAVIMLELAKEMIKNGETYIQVNRSLKQGDNISFQGEDIAKGKKIIEAGMKINPGIQSILATFGYSQVKVKRPPIIGVFAAGSELLDAEDALVPGKIRNSNSYMLCGQIERSGGKPYHYGIMPDSLEDGYTAIKEVLEEVDIIVTTGGVSVGDFDYMPIIYEKLQANILCNKIAMRPGSVTTIAEVDGKLLFGLSGNPSACYVGFELFLRPLIRDILGSKKPFAKKVKAVLGEDFPKANPFTRFVRSKLSFQDTRLVAKPIGLDKSSVIYSLGLADCLLILPGGSRGFQKGTEVEVLLLEDQEGGEIY